MFYINKNSNHPNNIKKILPDTVNKRLNNISCDIEEFDKVKYDYEDALIKSGFRNKLENKNLQKVKRKRKRKIILLWFSPPRQTFSKKNKYCKIFNRNTINISYSCIPNIETIRTAHNKIKINESKQQDNNTERK